jgi:hypothetical protein
MKVLDYNEELVLVFLSRELNGSSIFEAVLRKKWIARPVSSSLGVKLLRVVPWCIGQ